MPKHTIIEGHEVTRMIYWRYDVDADSESDALDRVHAGECEPECIATNEGDGDYGETSGWVALRPGERIADACERALEDMIENLA